MTILAPIPFVLNGPPKDVSAVDPAFRTLVWTPASAADQVILEGSGDGGTTWATRATFGSVSSIQKIEDCTPLLRARLIAGAGGKLFLVGQPAAAGSSPQLLDTTITHADLVAAATSQAFNFGNPLPSGAMVLGASAGLATRFAGGGATAATFQIGTAFDLDSIVSSCDVFNNAIDGQASSLSYGIAPNRFCAAATQLILTFGSDVNVADLTAGSVRVRLAYCVPF